MLPLLLTFPQLTGFEIGLRPAVGITMLQSLTGSFSGMLVHQKHLGTDMGLAVVVGGSAAAGSLGGAVFSPLVSERQMAILFAMMAAMSLLLLLIPERREPVVSDGNRQIRYPAALLTGGGVGFLAGIVGQGGAFIILPLMIHLFGVSVRRAIGTTTVIAFLSALAGFVGKWATGQVPLPWAIAVSAGALAGGQLGGILSYRLSSVALRRILLAIVLAGAGRILLRAFQ